MKHILSILFLLTIGFTACQRNTPYPLAMQQAEELMNTRPDSALTLLVDMEDTLTMLPEEAQMYYHLLTIQAKDKQYITHTSDSLINRIVSYYEESGDKERLMMAYYYQGSTYRDMNDAPRALKAFQQALDLNVPNYDLQAKAYNQMGTLFMYQGLHDEVIRVNRKAIELYLLQGKRNKISYFQRDIARMYDLKNVPDSALHYYKNAYLTALEDGDSVRYYGILGELGGYYNDIGEFGKAKDLLFKAKESDYIPNVNHILLNLSDIYEQHSQFDSAHLYYHKVLNDGDTRQKCYAYYAMAWMENRRGNLTQAMMYMNQYIPLKDSLDQITQTESIARINALYNYQHTIEENANLKIEQEKQQNKNLVFLLILFGGIVFTRIIFLHLKKKSQEELRVARILKQMEEEKYNYSLAAIKENELKIQELGNQLQEALKKHDSLTAKQLEEQQEDLQVNNKKIILLQREQELRIADLRSSSIYNEFKQASVNEEINISSTNSPEKWILLREAIDKAYPFFIEHIHLIYPHLSSTEEQVCLLTKLGIPPSGIATIQKCTRQCISNIRTRIHKRIQSFGGKYSNFDDFIDSF